MTDGAILPGSAQLIEAATFVVPLTVPAAPVAKLQGMLDTYTRQRITGWACAPGHDGPVALQILANGLPIGQVLANQLRPDLVVAGIGTGHHGFDLLIPGGLPPLQRHVIDIRRESDGARLPGAPGVIEPADAFGTGMERAVTAAVTSNRVSNRSAC